MANHPVAYQQMSIRSPCLENAFPRPSNDSMGFMPKFKCRNHLGVVKVRSFEGFQWNCLWHSSIEGYEDKADETFESNIQWMMSCCIYCRPIMILPRLATYKKCISIVQSKCPVLLHAATRCLCLNAFTCVRPFCRCNTKLLTILKDYDAFSDF